MNGEVDRRHTMKRTILFFLVSVAGCWIGRGEDSQRMVAMRFNNASLPQVAQYYAYMTSNSVTIDDGVFATVTLVTEKQLTLPEAQVFMEQVLRKQNVGIVKTSTNACVMRWIDSTLAHPQGAIQAGRSGTGTPGESKSNALYRLRRALRERQRQVTPPADISGVSSAEELDRDRPQSTQSTNAVMCGGRSGTDSFPERSEAKVVGQDALQTDYRTDPENRRLVIRYANPSRTEAIFANVRTYLPRGLQTNDIVRAEHLAVGYDGERSVPYLHGEIGLRPWQVRTISVTIVETGWSRVKESPNWLPYPWKDE